MKILKKAVFVAVLSLSVNVNAAVISVDWLSSGDNLITRDTVSGLDWLDLTTTSNLSYETVLAQQTAGSQFDGWRYASTNEVTSLLLSNFGIDLNNGNTTIGLPPPPGLAQATSLFGDSLSAFDQFTGLSGVTSESNLAMNSHLVVGADYNFNTQTFFRRINPNLNTFYLFDLVADTVVGHWLVADTPWTPTPAAVPVPAAAWLFATALIGLGAFKNRSTKVAA